MPVSQLGYYKQLELATRRPDALHPDACSKLKIRGVAWAIPPRGLRIVPSFCGDQVELRTAAGDWPQARRLLALVPVADDGLCPKCRQPIQRTLQVRLDNDQAFLAACFGLAGRLLRAQYDLPDETLSDLLGIEGDALPPWLPQLLRWCVGLGTEPAPIRDAPRPDGGGRKGDRRGLLSRLLARK